MMISKHFSHFGAKLNEAHSELGGEIWRFVVNIGFYNKSERSRGDYQDRIQLKICSAVLNDVYCLFFL